MSHSMERLIAGIEYDARENVARATFGHLAPKRNKTYTGRIVYCIGCYDCGDLNPTPIVVDFGSLSSSPWSYSAIHDWLRSLDEIFRKEGCVYEFVGTFRNYKLSGTIRLLVDACKPTITPCTSRK